MRTIDPATNNVSEVGSTGVSLKYVQDICFDFDTGSIYWAQIYDVSTAALYVIDKATGAATMIGTTGAYGLELSSMFTVPEDEPEMADVPVNGVQAYPSSVMISVGETAQLTAIVTPFNATNKNVVWSVDDASVISVDQNGLVTGVGEGTARVYVTTEEGGYTAYAVITVLPALGYLIGGYYFETDPLDEGWQFVDLDGDGHNWMWFAYDVNYSYEDAYEGIGFITSASWDSNDNVLNPDNWAIAPAVSLPIGMNMLTLYAKGQDPSYVDEIFGIFAGTSADPDSMTQIGSDVTVTADYVQYRYDLSAFAGHTVYIAIRHYNVTDMFRLNVDNVEIWSENPGSLTVTYTGAYTGSDEVPYGWAVTLPELNAEGVHYTFTVDGEPWDGMNVTEDITVTVGLEVDVYTVSFCDGVTGAIIDTQQVAYGGAATAPEAPYHYGHNFTGWDAEFDYVTGDITVNAVYENVLFTVTFTDGYGNVISVQQVRYQFAAEEPAIPEAPEGIRFAGWDADFSYIEGDLIVNATWEEIICTVIFYDPVGDTVLDTQQVPYGGEALAPNLPEHEGYEFLGWDKDFSCVKEDMTVNAEWAKLLCVVTFTGVYNGTVTVPYGEDCELPVYPSETVHYTFMVNGEYWDGECVTSDITVFVSAAPNAVRCTVTFVDPDTGRASQVPHGFHVLLP